MYGITNRHGELAYLIPDDNYIGYPAALPARLFGKPIGTLPAGLSILCDEEEKFVSLMPAICATDDLFWDRLTDGDVEARRAWVSFRLAADSHAWIEINALPNRDEIFPTLFIAQESSMMSPDGINYSSGYH